MLVFISIRQITHYSFLPLPPTSLLYLFVSIVFWLLAVIFLKSSPLRARSLFISKLRILALSSIFFFDLKLFAPSSVFFQSTQICLWYSLWQWSTWCLSCSILIGTTFKGQQPIWQPHFWSWHLSSLNWSTHLFDHHTNTSCALHMTSVTHVLRYLKGNSS